MTWDKPVHIAAGRGLLSDLEHHLVNDPAAISARGFNGMTPLHVAALRGQEAAVSRLLSAGASPFEVDGSQWTALHHASSKGHVGVIYLLLLHHEGHHVDPINHDGMTPLHIGIMAKQTEAVRALLHLGANATLRDHKGRKPGDLLPHNHSMDVHEMLQMASYQSYALHKLWNMSPPNMDQPTTADEEVEEEEEEESTDKVEEEVPLPPTLYEVHRDSEDYPMTARVLHWTLVSMKPDTFRELCKYLF